MAANKTERFSENAKPQQIDPPFIRLQDWETKDILAKHHTTSTSFTNSRTKELS